MFGLSDEIIRDLTTMVEAEKKALPDWIEKKYIAECVVPLLPKASDVQCNIAIAAQVSAGKSTLLNALCGYPILPTASKTTSAVPTYITRADSQEKECITVYKLNKTKNSDTDATKFSRDEKIKKAYYAKDISKEMFDDLFNYMYYVVHGVKNNNNVEFKTMVENVAYFAKDSRTTDILLGGTDPEKFTVEKDDLKLDHSVPRHRLLLLMILLCVYVDQNDKPEVMTQYTKDLNTQRVSLLNKYGFPADGDYCVCLDWCSEDIPDNVTLIDLPGTGSVTVDNETKSSHSALVRGIISDADAVWVMCSSNGNPDRDLFDIINDILSENTRQNKVCIYNPMDNYPNNSQNVREFLKTLPCLIGERCYVVNALAGEHKFIQNGVNALKTKTAFNMRNTMRKIKMSAPGAESVEQSLEYSYKDEEYFTFNSHIEENAVVVEQDSEVKHTMDSFFKNALQEYVERLKYEVVLKKTMEQADFFGRIRKSLNASRKRIIAIGGKDKKIQNAVIGALTKAKEQATNSYAVQRTSYQTKFEEDLQMLSGNMKNNIDAEFKLCLSRLIDRIHEDWRTLVQPENPNCLNANMFGIISLRENNENLEKFKRVGEIALSRIHRVPAFSKALDKADAEVRKYEVLLREYVNSLKTVTYNFANDYLYQFSKAYNLERQNLQRHG